jgi:hypothetical protein
VRRVPWPLAALRDAAIIGLATAGLGFGVNALRPDGLPFLAERDYEILVPCPEVQGEADALLPDDPALGAERTLMVDARAAEDFAAWHAPGALHLPYDYLEPISPEALKRIARSGAARVVVYGDGEDPDSGEQLAREMAGRGIRNAAFVRGGAEALRRARGEGRAP